MDFFINKTATLPILLMRLTYDSRIDYWKFQDMLENCAITFSMVNEKGIYKIANAAGILVDKPKTPAIYDGTPEFYIAYKFTSKDTNTTGKFLGQFRIDFFGLPDDPGVNLGSLIVPIKRDLNIYVTDSFVKLDIDTLQSC
jgi:hypothetical protein